MDEEFSKETDRLLEEALLEREAENETEEESEEEINEEETEEESNEETETKTEENDEKEETKSTFKPIEIEVNGIKVNIDSEEAMLAYVKEGAKNFKKEDSNLKEEETIIKQGNLSAEDLKLIVDAKNGSKEAIALIAKRAGVDILDVEEEMANNYRQQQEYYQQTEVDTVVNKILEDETHAAEFRRIAKALPTDFINEVTSNAKDLQSFSNHIKSGIAQQVIPLAINSQMINGGSFIDNYNKVGYEMSQKQANKQVRTVSEKEEKLRKMASSGSGHNTTVKKNSTEDIWNMSDEDFAKLDYSKLKD